MEIVGKINVGDRVTVGSSKELGEVIADRGGYVARWQVQLDSGRISFYSSRDCTPVFNSDPEDDGADTGVNPRSPEEWNQLSKDSRANILKKYQRVLTR